MSDIKIIERLISKYGENTSLLNIYNRLKVERPYKCPKCKGTGDMNICVDPGHLNIDERHKLPVFKSISCDLCDGWGYTKTEKKPITKTRVIGYE